MLKLFKKKEKSQQRNLMGEVIVLEHDATKFQYGSAKVDGIHYCIQMQDGSEQCKGTAVKIVEQVGGKLIAVKI